VKSETASEPRSSPRVICRSENQTEKTPTASPPNAAAPARRKRRRAPRARARSRADAGGLPPWIVAASSIFGACGAGEHQHARLGGGARRARGRRARTTVEAVRRADGRLFCLDVNALAAAARSKRRIIVVDLVSLAEIRLAARRRRRP